ncbi:type VI secretion system-associated FHA domain protein [Thaumasiovibrio sp. DFM-14]|uniref:type VI secretion system-associated FHA domain protein n=1 Tax=Thaumasiovibrio sp. DFM-14 TaxID=3384792 RepID=UPI0039A200C6
MKQTTLVLNVVDCPEEYNGTRQLEMDDNGGSIGRSAAVAFSLPDSDKYISSTHCLITSYNDEFYLNDVSTNGTFVNGVKIAKQQPQCLCSGDSLLIGRYKFEVIIEVSFNRQDIAADILPAIDPSDPLSLFDPIIDSAEVSDVKALGDFFTETTSDDEILSDDPLDHLVQSKTDDFLIKGDVVIEPAPEAITKQALDDSDDIYAEMMMPLIPENWHQSSSSFEPSKSEVESQWVDVEKEVLPDVDVPRYGVANCRLEESERSVTSSTLENAASETVIRANDNSLRLLQAFMRGMGVTASEQTLNEEFLESLGIGIKCSLASLARQLNDAERSMDSEPSTTPKDTDLMNTMLSLYQEHRILPDELLDQVVEDVERHQNKLLDSSFSVAKELLNQLSPVMVVNSIKQEKRIFLKKTCWDRYAQTHRKLLDSVEHDWDLAMKKQYAGNVS